ncbi:hypothetical protein M422DRAFT_261712 [Sphaerobolus stellatus SS14]|uniref:Uncharacterized protein n=1 Tax=Sphaerobolus stellatus (strain SS14) TaxID=990650 RepID=A0A0C9VEG1_SPHS4|nr:hypothetical protein M422DRAFT_261712 [Sphaerobolus stellatus SS14]
MYVPLVSVWLNNSKKTKSLERRKGGGKGGGGKGGSSEGSEGSSGSSGSSSSGSSGSSRGSSSDSDVPIRSGTSTAGTASAASKGTTKVTTIPSGGPFAGRMVGGGTRDQIYGTSQYGSGYPGQMTSGVIGRGFPFGFWPLTFGGLGGFAIAHQINSHEYGDPTNSSRPGGALFTAPFQAPNTNANTYRLLSDNATLVALIPSIISSCTPSSQNISPTPFSNSSAPKPEQIIQYYRSSSIALSLDGYNNTAVFSNDSNAKDTPLPTIANQTFLECLNSTIGGQALLLDSAATGMQLPGFLMSILVVVHMGAKSAWASVGALRGPPHASVLLHKSKALNRINCTYLVFELWNVGQILECSRTINEHTSASVSLRLFFAYSARSPSACVDLHYRTLPLSSVPESYPLSVNLLGHRLSALPSSQSMSMRYFRHHASKDTLLLRLTVMALILLGTLEAIFSGNHLYDIFITKVANPALANRIHFASQPAGNLQNIFETRTKTRVTRKRVDSSGSRHARIKRTDSLINRLIFYAINRAIATSICALLNVFLVRSPSPIYGPANHFAIDLFLRWDLLFHDPAAGEYTSYVL